MILLNPLALLLLLLAGPIIILYFLHRRPRRYKVSALFLWKAAQARPSSFLYLLRTPPLLLLLQLLILSLLSLGLADPVFYREEAAAFKKIAIIIDGSASMRMATRSASPSPRTRYEEALEQAIAIVQQAAAEQITVIQAQKHSKILAPLTKDRTEIIYLMKESQPTFQGDADPSELIQLLRSQGELADFDRIFYLTDTREILKDLPLELILVGGASASAAANVGITSFAVRPSPSRSLGYSALVTVENYSDSETKVETKLKVTADEETILETDIIVEPHSRSSFSFPYLGLGKTRFAASIDVKDDLDHDNRRYFALLPAKKDLLWIGERDRFLEGAIAAAGPFKFHYASASDIPQNYENYEFIVVNNAQLDGAISGSGNILLVNSSYPPFVEAIGEAAKSPAELPAGLVALKSHPILQNIDISDILVAEVSAARVAKNSNSNSEVILASGGHPVLTLLERDGLRLIFLGINLRASNLVVTVDFPILVRNMLSWLLPLAEGPSSLEVGESISLAGLGPEITIRDPKGGVHKLEGQLAFGETDLPGFYQVATGEDLYYWAVNSPAAESQLSPVTSALQDAAGLKNSLKVQSLKVTSHDFRKEALWQYLGLGGLLVLLLELYYYERSL